MKFKLKSIGVIHSPYKNTSEIPRQGVLKPETEGRVVVDEDYREGLDGLDQFSHAVLIFYFHGSGEERLRGTPPGADRSRGVFAIRGPHRPNRLGLSVVEIKKLTPEGFVFGGVDMLDGTPLVDIKPYVGGLVPPNSRGPSFQGTH
jgi:tRNA-Thr(GGU) m(6)t(6)A37 methyltransferase TsaA